MSVPDSLDSPAVTAYLAALPPGKTVEFPITALDRVGIPTWSAILYLTGQSDGGGQGYGTTEREARIGAYGEMTEGVNAIAAMQRVAPRRATYRELRDEAGVRGVVDPITLCLNAGSPYTPEMPLHWVVATRWGTDERVYVPVEFVALTREQLIPGTEPLVTPITNGLGAGGSLEQAMAHGLLELLQRDGNSVNYRALAQGTAIDLDTVTDSVTRALLARLDAAGVETVVKVAATDFDMANVYVAGYDREPNDATAFTMAAGGEAVHPDREAAVRKAVTEFAAARARYLFSHGPLAPVRRVAPPGYLEEYFRHYDVAHEEPRALAAMIAWRDKPYAEMRRVFDERVFHVDERVPMDTLPTVPAGSASDPTTRCTLVIERLQAAGFDVLYADFSPPDHPDVRVVRAIVPGLEVETMSYGRVGARNLVRLLRRGDVDFVGVGEPPRSAENAERVPLTERGQSLVGGPAWLDRARLDRFVGDLYMLYREPGRHSVALMRGET